MEGPHESYFRQTAEGGSWHPISQEPLTRTLVSSVTISASPMNDWSRRWLDYHYEHAEPGMPSCGFRRSTDNGYVYAVDEEDLDAEEYELAKCCDEYVPTSWGPIVVRASGKSYVTIHDLLTTVHPWLMARREEVLSCLGQSNGDPPMPMETRLVVDYDLPNRLEIEVEHNWLRNKRSQNGERIVGVDVRQPCHAPPPLR